MYNHCIIGPDGDASISSSRRIQFMQGSYVFLNGIARRSCRSSGLPLSHPSERMMNSPVSSNNLVPTSAICAKRCIRSRARLGNGTLTITRRSGLTTTLVARLAGGYTSCSTAIYSLTASLAALGALRGLVLRFMRFLQSFLDRCKKNPGQMAGVFRFGRRYRPWLVVGHVS